MPALDIDTLPLADAAWRQRFRRRLLAWYGRHARDLPWRRTRDPYHVWLSEIMLQQTQVTTVVPYFLRFVSAFPSIEALAAAREQDVLRHWEGLGYYRRAGHLWQAAREIVHRHAGQFPQDPQAARALPGIGRYTAGAILSIAFEAAEPILEANTYRLLSRLLAYRQDPRGAAGQKLLWRAAAALLPRKNIGDFNQALMELGAEVCLPKAPKCEACPVSPLCPTRELGLQAEIPASGKKLKFEDVRHAAVIVRRNGKVLLIKQEPGDRWAGLWDFVRFPLDKAPEMGGDELAATVRDTLQDRVQETTGLAARVERRLTTIKHGVTRFRITLDCYLADYVSRNAPNVASRTIRWVTREELNGLPLSSTGRKLARMDW